MLTAHLAFTYVVYFTKNEDCKLLKRKKLLFSIFQYSYLLWSIFFLLVTYEKNHIINNVYNIPPLHTEDSILSKGYFPPN